MKAYKRVSVDFAEAVADGSIRLGTAEEFRRIEIDEVGRGDPNELARTATIMGGSETLPGDHPTLADKVFFYKRGQRIFPEVSIVGATTTEIVDAYLYCCSLEVDDDERLGEALFEITDVEEFARRLNARPELNVRHFEQGAVTYSSLVDAKSAAELVPVEPFEKDKRFEWQHEYRLMWSAQPWERTQIIEAPEVRDLLQRLS